MSTNIIAPAALNERFTVWTNTAGEPVQKALREMTGAEVLKAGEWLEDECERLAEASDKLKALTDPLHQRDPAGVTQAENGDPGGVGGDYGRDAAVAGTDKHDPIPGTETLLAQAAEGRSMSTDDNGVHTPPEDQPEIDALPDNLAALWLEHFAQILPTMQERGRVYLDVTSVHLFHPDLLAGLDWVQDAMAYEDDAINDDDDEPAEQPAPEAYEETPSDQVYGPLQTAYELFNRALFDSQLPDCLITLQRKARTKGYFARNRFSSMDGDAQTDEIAMNPAHFRVRPPRETASTLVHEMCHLWQHHFGTPRRPGYHDRQWAAKMLELGLQPSSTGAPGGKTTGYQVSHYILPDGRFDRAWATMERAGLAIGWGDAFTEGNGGERAKPKRLKFVCPNCGANVMGKATTDVRCNPCDVVMVSAGGAVEADHSGKRDLQELAKSLGYAVERTKRGHMKCKHPNGALVHVSASGDVRGQKNARADLQRGVHTPQRQ